MAITDVWWSKNIWFGLWSRLLISCFSEKIVGFLLTILAPGSNSNQPKNPCNMSAGAETWHKKGGLNMTLKQKSLFQAPVENISTDHAHQDSTKTIQVFCYPDPKKHFYKN